MSQSMFIVWRESVEALLVIGILQAWVGQQSQANRLAKYLCLARRCWGVERS